MPSHHEHHGSQPGKRTPSHNRRRSLHLRPANLRRPNACLFGPHCHPNERHRNHLMHLLPQPLCPSLWRSTWSSVQPRLRICKRHCGRPISDELWLAGYRLGSQQPRHSIPSKDLVNQITAAGASPNHFGPYDDTSVGTRLVRIQRSIYVPPQLLPYVINMEDATPMVAFNLIAAQIQDSSLMQELDELLVWLLACAARVAHATGGTRIQPRGSTRM
jgi:hypothetical protein